MAFEVSDPESFDHRKALVRMLALLEEIIAEIWEFREILSLPQSIDYTGFELALEDIRALKWMTSDLSMADERLLDFGLSGDRLRFKMLVIQAAERPREFVRNRALEQAVERNRRGWTWGSYRRVLDTTLSAIDGPLESLTKALGAKEAVVEFKKGLEVLLRL